MYTYFSLVAIALAVASANNRMCDTAEQQTAYTSMLPLMSLDELKECAAKSGFNLMGAKTAPDPTQQAAMCKVPACHTLITKVMNAGPPDCQLMIPTSGAFLNIKTMAYNFGPQCGDGTSARSFDEATEPVESTIYAPSPAAVENIDMTEQNTDVTQTSPDVSKPSNYTPVQNFDKTEQNNGTAEQTNDMPEQDTYMAGKASYTGGGGAPVSARGPIAC